MRRYSRTISMNPVVGKIGSPTERDDSHENNERVISRTIYNMLGEGWVSDLVHAQIRGRKRASALHHANVALGRQYFGRWDGTGSKWVFDKLRFTCRRSIEATEIKGIRSKERQAAESSQEQCRLVRGHRRSRLSGRPAHGAQHPAIYDSPRQDERCQYRMAGNLQKNGRCR